MRKILLNRNKKQPLELEQSNMNSIVFFTSLREIVLWLLFHVKHDIHYFQVKEEGFLES